MGVAMKDGFTLAAEEFLTIDEDGIDTLALEIESLEHWGECAADERYSLEALTTLTWREVAHELAGRAVTLGRLVKMLRDQENR